MDRGGGICGSSRPDGEDQVSFILVGKLYHLTDFFISQAHDTLGLGNTVQVQAITVHGFEQCSHDLRSLDSWNLKAILTAISKTLCAGRQIVGIAAGQAYGLEELSCFFHAVHFNYSFPPLRGSLFLLLPPVHRLLYLKRDVTRSNR